MNNKELLNVIRESQNVHREMAERKRKLVKKWEKTGLLEGLEVKDPKIRRADREKTTEHRKITVSQLLENQLKHLNSQTRDGKWPKLSSLLTEAPTNITSTDSDTEAWSNVIFPLVRKVFAETFAEELVSVQAMDMPTSYIFFLDYYYATDKPDNFASPQYLYSQSDSLYGDTEATASDQSTGMSGGPTGRWYGGTDFSYTRNYVSAAGLAFTTHSVTDWAEVEYDADLSASLAAGEIFQIRIAHSEFTTAATNGSGSIATDQPQAVLLTSGSGIKAQYRRFNTYESGGNWTFICSGSSLTQSDNMPQVEYIAAGSETARGDFEAGQTDTGAIPQIKIKVTRKSVEATTRRLKTTWSEEEAQDMEAYQGLSVEDEFVDVMTKVLSQEIDLQILNELRTQAIDTWYWDRKVNSYVNKTTGAPEAGTTSFYGTQQEWYQTLYETLVYASNIMHKRTHLGGATHLVVSPEMSTILEASGLMGTVDASGVDPTSMTYSGGMVQFVGGLGGASWKIFKSPYVPESEILMVRKGASWLDTGYVYAPYIPMTFTDTLVDPADFSLVKGVMMRGATETVKPEFFSRVIVKHINTF